MEVLENVQGKATELVKRVEEKSDEEQLRVSCLEERKLRENFIALYNSLKGRCSRVGIGLCSQAAGNSLRGQGLDLQQGGLVWFIERVKDIGTEVTIPRGVKRKTGHGI
ncbi:hypothetical protein DUI87_05768 [Hirundo rustica rustica]|uniref:Uncharacterized protein n=1 Tax=Hirundo rustica rustica TaxID=333673 RepID=A0A3M0KWX4_HIRRU|nr:hypothetical protein DUI87_05768 [Hirundo rustica rustica]